MKKTLFTIFLALFTAVTVSATSFIKDVMLIGGTKDEVNSLKTSLTGQGWTVIDQDLNAGASGDYIYLLYKSENNAHDINLGYITDFYISDSEEEDIPDEITYSRRTYHLVSYDGGTNFKKSEGDLNRGAGGKTIHLYYTKDTFSDNRAVSSILFNTSSSGAVVWNGTGDPADLNKGCGSSSDYIYMHVTTATATALTSLQIGEGTSATSIIPFYLRREYYPYYLSQQIYTAEEIGKAGTIRTVSFYHSGTVTSLSVEGVRIYMKHTEKDSFTGLELDPLNADFSKVFEGDISFSGPGWVTIFLDTPFEYDGDSNLMICCYDPVGNHSAGNTFSYHVADNKMRIATSRDPIDLNETLGDSDNTMQRNDIRLDIVPNPYPNPAKLAVTGFTDKTASISWSAPIGTQSTIRGYKWQYKTAEATGWSALQSTTGTTASLTGLSAFTEYMFRVKVIYNGEESSYSVIRFHTAVELPYICGFENGMLGWSQVDHNQFYGYDYTSVFEDAKHDGSYGYRFQAKNENKVPQYLISPGLPDNVPISVSFFFRNSVSSVFETFQVGYSTTTPDIDAFTWGDEICEQSTEWTRYENNFPVGTKYVAVKYISNLDRLYLDDFEFTAYSPYAKPTDLSVDELKDNSVKLKWAAPSGAAGYAYQYRQVNGNDWSSETSVSGTSVMLSGLSANTTYDFRVKAFHGSNGTNASNFETIRFMTEGPMESLPHFQDFEDGMGGWRLEQGWGRSGITTSPQHEGSYSFEFDEGSPSAQYLRSPMLEGSARKVLSFYAKNFVEPGSEPDAFGCVTSFQLGWSTATNRLDEFVFTTKQPVLYGRWIQYMLPLPEGTRYVAIKVNENEAWLYLDDISIDILEDKIIATKATFFGEEKYLASFYNKTSDYQLPVGTVAYTVVQDGDELVFLRIGDGESREIPAGTPVVVVAGKESSDTGDTKNLALTLLNSTEVSARPGNILQASDIPVAVTDGKIGEKTVYVLGVKNGVPGFYQFDGDVIPAGKAYILK